MAPGVASQLDPRTSDRFAELCLGGHPTPLVERDLGEPVRSGPRLDRGVITAQLTEELPTLFGWPAASSGRSKSVPPEGLLPYEPGSDEHRGGDSSTGQFCHPENDGATIGVIKRDHGPRVAVSVRRDHRIAQPYDLESATEEVELGLEMGEGKMERRVALGGSLVGDDVVVSQDQNPAAMPPSAQRPSPGGDQSPLNRTLDRCGDHEAFAGG